MRYAIGLVVVLLLGLSGCTDNSNPSQTAPSATSDESPLPAGATGLRGVPVEGVSCSPDSGSTQPKPVTSIDTPALVAVCFQHEPLTSSGTDSYISIKAEDPPFEPIVKALSQPNIPVQRSGGCATNPDTPIYAYAQSGDQWFRLTIPVDGCDLYREAAKAALGPIAWGMR